MAEWLGTGMTLFLQSESGRLKDWLFEDWTSSLHVLRLDDPVLKSITIGHKVHARRIAETHVGPIVLSRDDSRDSKKLNYDGIG